MFVLKIRIFLAGTRFAIFVVTCPSLLTIFQDDDEPVVQDEDEEFAVVSKPKHLSSQVVRGNTNSFISRYPLSAHS
jgi:hypothetical protein